MKTSFLALALVALGVSAQASPAPAKAAAKSGSANTESVDYRCYYNCVREGRDDCDWLCYRPGPDIPMAAAPAKPALQKRDHQCYLWCIAGCNDGDSACKNQCARDCSGSGGPPAKKQ